MSNAIINRLAPVLLFLTLFTACTSEKEEKTENSEQQPSINSSTLTNTTQPTDSALLLSTQIDKCLSDGQWDMAIILIDSLNSTYITRTDLRASTLLTRAKAIEGQTMDSIAIVDARFVSAQLEMDSLKRFMTGVRDPRLSGYAIDKNAANLDLLSGGVIQPRLGDSLDPWTLEVSVKGHPGIKGLRATIDGRTIEVRPTQNMKSRRIQGEDIELFSFSGDEAETLAQHLNGRAKSNLSVTVLTDNGNAKITLTPAIQNAIWRTWRYAYLRDKNNSDIVHRQYLENKLMMARDQIARYTTYN